MRVGGVTGVLSKGTLVAMAMISLLGHHWEVQWPKEGDSLARYLVRIGEMVESIKIIQQALEGIPGGPYENLEIRCFDREKDPSFSFIYVPVQAGTSFFNLRRSFGRLQSERKGSVLLAMEEPNKLRWAIIDASAGAISGGISRTVTSPLLRFDSCGALAGCAATVGSYPFDLLRTILASQGELKDPKAFSSFIMGILSSSHHESLKAQKAINEFLGQFR
ncbi:hypothetical protein K1719_040370 [Acacia pycnantha]|nr:hypothetical protein K1719_040370 [Acacia pycnantha]